MEEALRALLLGSTAVTDLCGQRINWGGHPQGADYPSLVLHVIDDSEGHTLEGPDGLSVARVQVDCWGDTYKQANGLARAVRARLDGHSGASFDSILLLASRDDRRNGTNEATRRFRVFLDFTVNWRA
jgi:hypothetical protein